MTNGILRGLVLAAVFGVAASLISSGAFATNVDNTSKYAWSENAGWLNAQPSGTSGPGLTVTDAFVAGLAWGENIGWVNFDCITNSMCGGVAGNWGVTNDGAGHLKGYAWGENIGWINLSCATNNACGGAAGNWGVNIDPSTGVVSGYAWAENIGWINFNCSNNPSTCAGSGNYRLVTSWRSGGGDTDGDGCPDAKELGPDHTLGGQRDPNNPYDFFDVPIPYRPFFTLAGKNKGINSADVLNVRAATGTLQGQPGYNQQYDRLPAIDPSKKWLSRAPNGGINAADVLTARDSTGDLCL